MTRGTLIVFVKAPRAGRVKTRLGREAGMGRAAVVFRRLTELTLAQAVKFAGPSFRPMPKSGRKSSIVSSSGRGGRGGAPPRLACGHRNSLRLVLAIDPPADIAGWGMLWPRDFERIPQSRGALGDRLRAATLGAPQGPVVVIGADAPGLRAGHLRAAFRALARSDAVFGPAEDGGYWLVGLARRRRAPRLFEDVRWSSAHALEDTVRSLPADFKIARLQTLIDIDEVGDIQAAGPIMRAKGGCDGGF